MEDALTTGTIGFNKAGTRVYLIDSRDRNTAALYIFGLDDSEKTLIAEDPRADFGGFMIHPTEKNVQAVAFNYERLHWKVIDPSVAADFDHSQPAGGRRYDRGEPNPGRPVVDCGLFRGRWASSLLLL